jgi:hypothetical protein
MTTLRAEMGDETPVEIAFREADLSSLFFFDAQVFT